ncbi:cysteine protease StiP domain-containing protein [Streptomyces sp. M19]
MSGLISRTVLRADLVGPDDFHGAKFYRELADADVSRDFLDAVAAHFDAVAGRWPPTSRSWRRPTAPRPGRAGRRSSGSARSTASTT